MNKVITTLFGLLIISVSFGQLADFKGGLEGGIMGTQVDGDTLSGYDKAGVRIGGFIEREINDKISMQFSMLYVQKGSKGDQDPDDFSSYYKINLHYIDMPITARYHHKSGVFGEAGIALGYLFAQRESGNNEFGQYINDEDPGFNKIEFSYHLGVGYKLFPYTSVHAQFSYSMLKIRGKYNSQIPGVWAGQYNNTLSIALQIYLGKRQRT
jgi:hypothetical protein